MFYANLKKGIILNGLIKPLKGRKENYIHEEDFIKEGKKINEKGLGELKQRSSLTELTIKTKEFTDRANKDRDENDAGGISRGGLNAPPERDCYDKRVTIDPCKRNCLSPQFNGS